MAMTTLTREERIQKLKDRFLVITYSHKRGCMLFLQDPTLTYNPNYIWTQFKTNSISFETEEEAINYANQLNLQNFRTQLG